MSQQHIYLPTVNHVLSLSSKELGAGCGFELDTCSDHHGDRVMRRAQRRKRRKIPVIDQETELSDTTMKANLADDSCLLRSHSKV